MTIAEDECEPSDMTSLAMQIDRIVVATLVKKSVSSVVY